MNGSRHLHGRMSARRGKKERKKKGVLERKKNRISDVTNAHVAYLTNSPSPQKSLIGIFVWPTWLINFAEQIHRDSWFLA